MDETKYKFKVEKNYLYIKFTEPESYESCIEEAEITRELIRKYNLKNVLSDDTEKESFVDVLDEFKLSNYYIQNEFYKDFGKIAVLVKKIDYDKMKFWETATRNRGLRVQIFTDMEKTKEWLEINY